MDVTKVLLIENKRNNGATFSEALRRKYELQVAYSGREGLSKAHEATPDVIVLDAASLRTSGNRICSWLRQAFQEMPIIHIRPVNKKKGDTDADILLYPPFTSRKLINRIERFIEAKAESERLQLGSFMLNAEQQTLTIRSEEKKLTPKLTALMQFFMQHPNQTLDRKEIMKKVWKTDYVGDTRTLDVHIRWLRKIIEPDPRKPQYIVTKRGVGYRFMCAPKKKSKSKRVSKKKKDKEPESSS
jgi:DNA-binding response OmpR family regulator